MHQCSVLRLFSGSGNATGMQVLNLGIVCFTAVWQVAQGTASSFQLALMMVMMDCTMYQPNVAVHGCTDPHADTDYKPMDLAQIQERVWFPAAKGDGCRGACRGSALLHNPKRSLPPLAGSCEGL